MNKDWSQHFDDVLRRATEEYREFQDHRFGQNFLRIHGAGLISAGADILTAFVKHELDTERRVLDAKMKALAPPKEADDPIAMSERYMERFKTLSVRRSEILKEIREEYPPDQAAEIIERFDDLLDAGLSQPEG